jgi:hypothetical protein
MDGEAAAAPIIPRKAWDLRNESTERRKIYNSVLDGSILQTFSSDIKSQFRTIETTPGLQRKPPNLHPALLHASRDDAVLLLPNPPKTTHHTHPIVPNLHLLKDVLLPEECIQVIAAAETIGFIPDAPIRAEGDESSILAHNFYWIVDNAFSSKLWSRVQPFVPKVVSQRKVRGLNRRFRVYRYVPGAEYRAHIGKSTIRCRGSDANNWLQTVLGLLLQLILLLTSTSTTLLLPKRSNPLSLPS